MLYVHFTIGIHIEGLHGLHLLVGSLVFETWIFFAFERFEHLKLLSLKPRMLVE